MLTYSVINMQMIWPLELPLNLHCTLKTTDIYFRSILQILLPHSIHYWYYKIFKYVGHSMLERLFREKKCSTNFPQPNHENTLLVMKNHLQHHQKIALRPQETLDA